jgi:hypothetical protein
MKSGEQIKSEMIQYGAENVTKSSQRGSNQMQSYLKRVRNQMKSYQIGETENS